MNKSIFPLVLLWAAAAAAQPPPVARTEPIVDDYFGIKVADPYRWMESTDKTVLNSWMQAQAGYTQSVLGAAPGRQALFARIRQLNQGGGSNVRVPVTAGGRIFYRLQSAGELVAKVYVRDGAYGSPRVLVDPARFAGEAGHAEVGFIEPSKDGKYLAYSIATGGGEVGSLRVVEVGSGKDVDVDIDRMWGSPYSAVSWRDDNRSFFYMRFPKLGPGQSPDQAQQGSRVYLHVLGRNASGEGDVAVFGYGVAPGIKLSPADFSAVVVAPGSGFAIAEVSTVDVNFDGLYVAPLRSIAGAATPWHKLADVDDQIVYTDSGPALHGNELYLVTGKDAPHYKLLRVDMRRPDLKRAELVLPDNGRVIEDIAAASDALYVQQLDGGRSRLLRIPYRRGAIEEVALPPALAIRNLSASPAAAGAWLSLRSWIQSPGIFRVNPDARVATDMHWIEPSTADFSGVEAREVNVTSYDGTSVPLSLILKKGAALDGAHPTILNSYGAYGLYGTQKPYFEPTWLAWIERGGIIAYAHPRGGGEYGEPWHQSGMKKNKLNTVFDTIACAEYLVDQRYTSPKALALYGDSAGGIAFGAITWRPELFAAAIDHAGVTDTLRFETTVEGPLNVPEFGSVKTLEGFQALYAMSPYTRVRDGTAYPAVLLETGINDPRVDSWVVGKMAARLQAATASGKPVLLNVDFDNGHGDGTAEQIEEQEAVEWTFLLWQFGDPDFRIPQNAVR